MIIKLMDCIEIEEIEIDDPNDLEKEMDFHVYRDFGIWKLYETYDNCHIFILSNGTKFYVGEIYDMNFNAVFLSDFISITGHEELVLINLNTMECKKTWTR